MNNNLFILSYELVNTILLSIILLIVAYFFFNRLGLFKYLSIRKDIVSEYISTAAKIKSIDYTPNGLITCTHEGKIVTWNKGAENIFGWQEREIIGKNLSTIIDDNYIYKILDMGYIKTDNSVFEIEGVKKDKTLIPIELTLSKWKDSNIIYYTGVLRDITNDSIQEEFHAILLKIYIEAEQISNYGAFKWNIITDKITVTDGFRKIWELDKGEYDYYSLINRIHYEDKARVDKVIQEAIRDKHDYKVSYRIIKRNGQPKQINVVVKLIKNSDNVVEKLIGVIQEEKNDDGDTK